MRRCLALLVVLSACSGSSSGPIGGDDDDDGSGGSGTTGRAHVISVTPAPGGEAWLHERVRFALDAPIAAAPLTVTATLAGEDVAATAEVEDSGTEIDVALDPQVAGTGDLAIALSGKPIEDAEADYTVSPWAAAPAATALAVTSKGDLYAAAIVDGKAVVAGHGDPLGAAVTSIAVGADADDRLAVAYVDNGRAIAVGWDGASWIPLVSCAGTQVALAGDALAVATAGGIDVYRSWQKTGTIAGSATEVAVAGDVVAWIDGAGAHFATLDGTALDGIPGATHVSLAARDGAVAVAWEQWSGSLGAYAAVLAGTSWQRLGGLLDVDPTSDAHAPAIALAADGDPIVAWPELIDGTWRGITARWDGAKWTIYSPQSWLASTTAAPSSPRLVLGAGDAPAIASDGGIARFNAAPVPALARAPLAGCSFSAASPAPTLLATGCFTLASPGVVAPHAGLVPYDVVSELWTDGAHKHRWIALPDGASMTTSATGAWAAPIDTFVIKEFGIDGHAVETRVLVNTASGWQGFDYKWRADLSDADLQTDGQSTTAWPLSTGGTYTHYYPSRSQCLSCHEGSFGPLLGIRPEQLRRWADFRGAIVEQLPTLVSLGVGPDPGTPALPSPQDASLTIERRTRGYMAANCAHCHNPNHIDIKDLRITTPLAQTKLCEAITPGAPASSRVYELVTERPGMPALGSLVPDPLIGSLVSTWISGMTSCP